MLQPLLRPLLITFALDTQVAVLVVELVIFRVLQVVFLSKLNNIEK